MKIQYLLQKSSILIDVKGTNKTEVLLQMAQFMASLYGLQDNGQIGRKILERETAMSTGIGCGVAIPHAKLNNIGHLYIVAARSVNGIEFEAIDGKPVHLLFMMISPEGTSTEHTQIISSLSSIMCDEEVRGRLLEAKDVETFLNIIIESENKDSIQESEVGRLK